MRIQQIRIHNFRSIIDKTIEAQGYLMLVGANNSGKSNVINALRAFYDDLKWSSDDFPKVGATDNDSWVELMFELSDEEWTSLADKYKKGVTKNSLLVRRYFKGTKMKASQSNIYAVVDGIEEDDLFYGAKNVSTAKVGNVIYIPALTTPNEQMKTTGPSPLRNMLNFLLKKVVEKSQSYSRIESAFKDLNTEANLENGFLSKIATPINNALSEWNVKLDLSVNPVSTEDISKNLVKPSFIDMMLGSVGFDLDRFGHGFQRSVIFELIKLSPTFKDDKTIEKKESNPDFDLILFEEPEAFLHPSQQELLSYHLRRLSSVENQQVFVTTHSQIFVGKSSDQINQIVRLMRGDGISSIFQLTNSMLESVFLGGGDFLTVLQKYIDDPDVSENQKTNARRLVGSAPTEEIAFQHEKFRYQLWLDSERASMFFAERVLLVEGATEKALFNYLLANQWYDLSKYRIFVVDALGKYNFHRYLALFECFGIPHGIVFDDDDSKDHHDAVNQFIISKKNQFTLADPVCFPGCLEKFLGLALSARDDQKPLEILRAIDENKLSEIQLRGLKEIFCNALGITKE